MHAVHVYRRVDEVTKVTKEEDECARPREKNRFNENFYTHTHIYIYIYTYILLPLQVWRIEEYGNSDVTSLCS